MGTFLIFLRTTVVGLTLLFASAAAGQENAAEDGWKAIPIPDAWKRAPAGVTLTKDGFAWFRCFVSVPEAWRDKDFSLYAESVDDAREFFFNGEKIGEFGTFPPEFHSGLGHEDRFIVPGKLVLFDQPNVVAVRIYQSDPRPDFNVAAPVLFGGEQAIRLQGNWQHRTGDSADGSRPSQRPADAVAYTKLESADEVNRSLKKLSGEEGPLSVEQSLARFKTPDDLKVTVAVAEPHIGQPLSFKFDSRGRMWVVNYLQYPNPAGLKMLSRDKFLRSVYDKVPIAPPNHERGADKITIHEDADGDGYFEKRKVFLDGLSLMSSFAIGRGGVWVLNPPYLLFYPDRNRDDVPDGDPEVHLEGFGIEDSHSIANSLRWGPDGWLYAAQGSTVTGHIKRPGSKDPPAHSMGQLIWRYHPEQRRYEIFAEGGGNSFGVEIDSKGRIFSGHNGGDTRGFHYVQGGYLQKGFGKHGELSNPFAFGYFPQMKHNAVPRFTHTFVINEADGLPARYRGKMFAVAPLQGHVVISDVMPDGSSFQTRDIGHAFTTTDTWCRPVDIQLGPDGAIYVADFYEQRIDHASHYQGRVDKTTGRIYRISGADSAVAKATATDQRDLEKLPAPELASLLGSTNRSVRQTALRLIGDRRDPSLIPTFLTTLGERDGQIALESLWALHLSGGLGDEAAVALLAHVDPFVRLWTVRLICDDGQVPPAIAEKLAALAVQELHVEVRSQLACSARRLSVEAGLPIVRNLLFHSEDAADIHLPLLLWWAIESAVSRDPDAVLALFADRRLWEQPILQQHIAERLMRRYAAAGTRRDLLACARLLKLAPDKAGVDRLLKGFEAAYQGRSLAGLPDELIAALAETGGGSLSLRLRQQQPDAVAEALKQIADEKADSKKRAELIAIFGELHPPAALDPLLAIALNSSSQPVREVALVALQNFPDDRIAESLVAAWEKLPAEIRPAAESLFASRRAWSEQLLAAVDAGRIDKAAISLDAVRKVLLHGGDRIPALVEKNWGTVQGATTEEMKRDIERFAAVIAAGSGNPYQGKQLYANSCGKCHTLFTEGGKIGPDLTSFKRDDLQRILVNVVNPSIEIREGFETHVVATADGRVLTGFIADQDNRVVVLRGVNGETNVISREDIDDQTAIPRSLMPEGILKPFTDQQIRDLFAYLRITQPLP